MSPPRARAEAPRRAATGVVSGWLVLLCLVSCQPGSSSSPETTAEVPTPSGVPDPEAAAFAEPIEQAHGLAAWRAHDGLRADITVQFGGERMLQGELLMRTDMSRTRIRRGDGSVVVWDGEDAWVSPPDAEFPRARFHALTWAYFLSAPMKLRDPGTYLESLGDKTLRGESYDAARLTFAPGVGDTPDDWYVLYRDPETQRLHAMAYIVTYGTTVDEAEAEPHAITYAGFEAIEGVSIPTEWTFWQWSEAEGIEGDPIGSVALRGVRFVTPAEDAFAVPEAALRHEMPES